LNYIFLKTCDVHDQNEQIRGFDGRGKGNLLNFGFVWLGIGTIYIMVFKIVVKEQKE
jgi:hypothetical protein